MNKQRIATIYDTTDTDDLTGYQYNGLSRLMFATLSQPDVSLDREILSFSTAKYWGLDRFGRVTTQYWRKGASTMVDKYIYTHDFASNRLTRENIVSGQGTPV